MDIQITTDHNIEAHEGLTNHVRSVVADVLGHLSTRITRVEVHLSDEHGAKHGAEDKKCVMEARLHGRQPTAVTEHAGSGHPAVDGAADTRKRALDHAIGRAEASH
ncbi:MAG: HPF/RaiA family ribosome-associated protein [Deltaproteobacteria bacterium]|nr:HPF/RaiA family ribosome-associated protein [Deltaproteobacteria bacterium]